jgi:hypothetical protein
LQIEIGAFVRCGGHPVLEVASATRSSSVAATSSRSRRISMVRMLLREDRASPIPGALAMAWSAPGVDVLSDFWIILRFAGSILVPKCARALGETRLERHRFPCMPARAA